MAMDHFAYLIFGLTLGLSLLQARIEGSLALDRQAVGERIYANLLLFSVGLVCHLVGAVLVTSSVLPSVLSTSLRLADISGMAFLPALLLLLLAQTFLGYWFHRATHSLPLLWRIHRVHHSDPVLDASTSLRHHPFEILLSQALISLTNTALAPPPLVFVTSSLLSTAIIIVNHMPPAILPDRLQSVLALAIVTPRVHNIHHSDHVAETDSNFGTVLSIWDRIFGTFLAAPQRRADSFRLGLVEVPPKAARNPLLLLRLPFMPKDLR